MKISIKQGVTYLKKGINHAKDRLFPVYYVKERIPPRGANLSGITEDTFSLQGESQSVHGVVMTRNHHRGIDYSLEQSKQLPLIYHHILHEPKQRSAYITNLTNELERVCYNGVEFDILFEEQPHLCRTVGSLPQKWGRKIGNSKEKREQVDSLFSEFGRKFHKKVKNEHSTVELSTRKLRRGLSKVLDSEVQIFPLGKGAWGRTYKVSVDSQDYVLKVYYRENSPKGYGSIKTQYHGNAHELSSAVWASKNDTDSYAMFYMGRFGENGDGYILTRYIPDEAKKDKIYNGMSDLKDENFVFSRYLHKLRCGDLHNKRNRHSKKIIDFGDTFVSEAGQLDEKTFRLTKTLGRLIDENNSKELKKVIEKYRGTEEFEQAKSFLQYLINKNATLENAAVLKSKKDLLNDIGIDYVPDIRYVIPTMRFPINVKYEVRPNYNEKCYSNIFGIPYNAFEQLWRKYPCILKTEA